MKSSIKFLTIITAFLLAIQTVFSPIYADDKLEKKEEGWKPLFQKGSLEGWEKTNFGGESTVEWNDEGELVLGRGEPMTGLTYTKGDFPKDQYEIRWEANRIEGSDFLAGITFPVAEEYCSFIGGGWGGGLTGISSINGNDASENETTKFKDFKNKQWYKFQVRVDAEKVQVWLDGEKIVDVKRQGKTFSIRAEVRPNRPLGYCVFRSKVAIRGLEYRTIEEAGK